MYGETGERANGSKRVILVTGGARKCYDQAIFIMKKDYGRETVPKDVILEAERIVSEYLASPKEAGLRPIMVTAEGHKRSGLSLCLLLSSVKK